LIDAGIAVGAAPAPPTVTASPISIVEGQSFSGVVGTISPCPVGLGGNGNIMIDWGDTSQPTEARITDVGGGSCSVAPLDPHTYAAAGTYTTVISDAEEPPPTTGSSTATVSDAPITLTAGTLSGTAGTQVSGALADLDDSGGLLPASDYTVTIDWGDGDTTAGAVNSSGEVVGAHTYAAAGSYSPTVTVLDKGGQSAHTTATVNVSAPTTPPPTTPPACTATAPAPGPAFSPSATTPAARWVQATYHDLLGRSPGTAELSGFTEDLGAGAPRGQLVLAIENSPEGAGDLVSSIFREYLHRSPTPSELSIFAQELTSGTTAESLRAQVLGSQEYLAGQGGGTVQGFLGGLFCDTLDRSITTTELSGSERLIAAGTTRVAVAQSVLSSPEYQQDLVRQLYSSLLRRAPLAGETQVFVQQLQSGATDQQLIADLLGSQEYFNEFSGGGVTLTNPSVTTGGLITVTLARPATIELVVLQLLSPAQSRDAAASRSPLSTAAGRSKPPAP
jgi:hypothetical protein